MMRASIVSAIVAGSCALAALGAGPTVVHAQPRAAEPTPSMVDVKPPAGWTLDEALTANQAKTLRDGAHLGGAARVTAAFYRSSPAGGAFIVSELVAEPAPADVPVAARAELASIRGIVEAAGGTLVEWKYRGGERTLPEARLEWKDPSVGTTSITRAIVMRTSGALVVVTGECVLASDATALRAPCEEALAALKPAASVKRVEVDLGNQDPANDAPAPAAAENAPGTGTGTGTGSAAPSTAPTMSEGGPEIPTTIMVRPPASKPDRRPLMLLGGVAVLALVYLWNRRQKARLDAAEAREQRRADERTARRTRDRDDDRDDEREGDRADADADADAADAKDVKDVKTASPHDPTKAKAADADDEDVS